MREVDNMLTKDWVDELMTLGPSQKSKDYNLFESKGTGTDFRPTLGKGKEAQ